MLRMGSLVAMLVLLVSSAHCADTAVAFYVATNGSDTWSGKLAQPNESRTDGPFATLEKARDAARMVARGSSPARIIIRKGAYYLDKPLALGPQDSNLSFSAYPGEKVVISGGKLITGFSEVVVNGGKMLAADIPEVREGKWNFAQLFINDRRRPRTRLPKEGFYKVAEIIGFRPEAPWQEGQNQFRFNEGDIRNWRNLSDVDIVALHFWIESRMSIDSVDEKERIVRLKKKNTFRLTKDFSEDGAPYIIENVFEALDTPGQWYLDRPQGVLYYYPYVGEDTSNLRVVAPILEQLVRVTGTAKEGQKVKNITFNNLHFAHTQHILPPDKAGATQAAISVPGALHFEHAEKCVVTQLRDSAHRNLRCGVRRRMQE